MVNVFAENPDTSTLLSYYVGVYRFNSVADHDMGNDIVSMAHAK